MCPISKSSLSSSESVSNSIALAGDDPLRIFLRGGRIIRIAKEQINSETNNDTHNNTLGWSMRQ